MGVVACTCLVVEAVVVGTWLGCRPAEVAGRTSSGWDVALVVAVVGLLLLLVVVVVGGLGPQ